MDFRKVFCIFFVMEVISYAISMAIQNLRMRIINQNKHGSSKVASKVAFEL